MCTGRNLIARVARARLPYAENLVSGWVWGRWVAEMFLTNAYTQGGQELGASAGDCRTGSIAGVQELAVAYPPPPDRLSATLADVFLALVTW
jgi:hypothetical protein